MKFTQKGGCDRHELTHDSQAKKLSCSVCKHTFRRKDIFRKHLLTHQDGYKPKKFVCEICSCSFNRNSSLHKHTISSHGNGGPLYTCLYCKINFKTKGALNQHTLTHKSRDERAIHSCDICGAKYVTSSVLKKHHKSVHLGIKEHACTLCDYKFDSSSALRSHLLTHNEYADKRHKCPYCDVTFSGIYHMKCHIDKIHKQ